MLEYRKKRKLKKSSFFYILISLYLSLVTNTKRNMEQCVKLFLPEYHERQESLVKKRIRKFILAYKLLQEFLSIDPDPESEESLEFYSNLYKESNTVLTEIVTYVISYGYNNRRKRVDESIRISQEICGLLKLLSLRYVVRITSQDPESDLRYYQISDLTNIQIVKKISDLFEEMYSLDNIKRWV